MAWAGAFAGREAAPPGPSIQPSRISPAGRETPGTRPPGRNNCQSIAPANIAAAMFAGAMLWQLFLPGGLVPGVSRPAGEIREGWIEGPGGAASRPANAPAQAMAEVRP